MSFHLYATAGSAVLFIIWNILFIGFRAASPHQSPLEDILDSLIAALMLFAFLNVAFFLGYFGIQVFVN